MTDLLASLWLPVLLVAGVVIWVVFRIRHAFSHGHNDAVIVHSTNDRPVVVVQDKEPPYDNGSNIG